MRLFIKDPCKQSIGHAISPNLHAKAVDAFSSNVLGAISIKVSGIHAEEQTSVISERKISYNCTVTIKSADGQN
jgi:hypothetical protein